MTVITPDEAQRKFGKLTTNDGGVTVWIKFETEEGIWCPHFNGCMDLDFAGYTLKPNERDTVTNTKESNPKDDVGIKKWRQYCTVPTTVIWELGVAMLEGSRKYGRHNYRVAGVRASVYVDAAKGHIDCYWEGEDIDPDSGLHHLTKAMASLAVLRDAMIQGKYVDDRPPKTDVEALATDLQKTVEEIFERYPDPVAPYTELNKGKKR